MNHTVVPHKPFFTARLLGTCSVILTAIFSSVFAALPASAEPQIENPPAKQSRAIVDYLASHPQITVVDEAIYSSTTATVVDGNGRVVDVIGGETSVGGASGLETSHHRVRRGSNLNSFTHCSFQNAVFFNTTPWMESGAGCSIIGWDQNATFDYHWVQDPFGMNSGPSCVQVRGYNTNPKKSAPVWTGKRCGAGASVTAHIGNRATVAKIRGHVHAVSVVPQIGYVRWR